MDAGAVQAGCTGAGAPLRVIVVCDCFQSTPSALVSELFFLIMAQQHTGLCACSVVLFRQNFYRRSLSLRLVVLPAAD